MKTMKFLGVLCFLLLLACSSDDSDNVDALTGVYTETSPIQGRTQLIFTEGAKVTKHENGESLGDVYDYVIDDNGIWFTLTGSDTPVSTQFDFEIIDNFTFEIENLYPSIPEDPVTYMIFEKLDF